jgi:hypothetical protein
MTRVVPEQIDEEIDETLTECPDCHHGLGDPVGIEEQVQEDIVPAHVRVDNLVGVNPRNTGAILI